MTDKRSEKGFSLVELMVALAILSIGISAVGVTILTSFVSDRYNRNIRNADEVLRYVSEQFSAGHPDPAIPTTGNAVIRGKSFILTTDVNPGTFYCSWTSTGYSTGVLQQLDIVIGWGKGLNCNRTTPEQCPHTIRMSNYY